jgi:hypothetical protein
MGHKGVDWIHLSQDKTELRLLVYMEINIGVPYMADVC